MFMHLIAIIEVWGPLGLNFFLASHICQRPVPKVLALDQYDVCKTDEWKIEQKTKF